MKTQHPSSRVAERSRTTSKQLVRSLGDFRREWQRAAGTADLVQVSAPIGLVIADIAARLRLSPEERRSVLGRQLNTAVSTYCEGPVHLK